MKRTLLAVACLCLASTAFASTSAKDQAKVDSLAETVTSLCQDAGVAKADMQKCELRVQAIVVAGVIATHSAPACINQPERVKELGLSEQCAAFERDSEQVNKWQDSLLAPQK